MYPARSTIFLNPRQITASTMNGDISSSHEGVVVFRSFFLCAAKACGLNWSSGDRMKRLVRMSCPQCGTMAYAFDTVSTHQLNLL